MLLTLQALSASCLYMGGKKYNVKSKKEVEQGHIQALDTPMRRLSQATRSGDANPVSDHKVLCL